MTFNLLISYAFHGKTDLRRVKREMLCGRMLIDSGAYTAFTKGLAITVDEYAEFLTTWAGEWDHAVTLDVIGNPVRTRENTRKLHQMGIPVMPVFTRGDGLKEFDAMVRESGYVCIGGLNQMDRPHQLARTKMLQRRASDLGGDIHALGIASMPLLREARPFSSDASTPAVGARYGNVLVFDAPVLRQVNIQNHAKLNRYRDLLVAHGFPVASLVQNRRVPNGEGAKAMTAAAVTAFMACDEYLKRIYPVTGHDGSPGPFLYSVAINQDDALRMAEADRVAHGPNPPRLWRQYSTNHICRREKVA